VRAPRTKVASSGEDRIVRSIVSYLLSRSGELVVPPGDDAAVYEEQSGYVALSIDATIAGVHVEGSASAADLGRKAFVRAASDIAAMGMQPSLALVQVLAPKGTKGQALVAVVKAASAEAALYGALVAGGDVCRAPCMGAVVAVVGRSPDGYVTRAGARPGDALFATDRLGAASSYLRRKAKGTARAHFRPRLATREGEAAKVAGATAMTDVSDGLVKDLYSLAKASGVGFALEEVPVHPAAEVEDALYGGDDYALIFTAPDPARVIEEFKARQLRAPLLIGRASKGRGVYLQGRLVPERGYSHTF
jgi:thiamine-monophosphate kinase